MAAQKRAAIILDAGGPESTAISIAERAYFFKFNFRLFLLDSELANPVVLVDDRRLCCIDGEQPFVFVTAIGIVDDAN